MKKLSLSINEASQFTGYKKSYLYRLVAQNKIPFHKPLNGKVFFDRLELEKFLIGKSKTNGELSIKEKSELVVQRNVPFPININRYLVGELLKLKDGDYTFLEYGSYTKSQIINSIAVARTKIAVFGLCIRTRGSAGGIGVWIFNNTKRE